MENKKLTRSNNRMLAGVCAGLADYFGWDVTLDLHPRITDKIEKINL